jgi:multicomponent K+:H+ antiporter subunit F
VNVVFDYAVWFAQVCVALAMLCAAIRLFIGPAAQDRVLAFDSLYMNGMLMLLLLVFGLEPRPISIWRC